MDVILLEKVPNLGNIGDQVNVKAGFGRNYLLPKGKATLATPANIAIFEARRAELEAKQAEELAAAQARADKLTGFTLTLTARVGSEGKLFGSIGTVDIAEAAAAAGAGRRGRGAAGRVGGLLVMGGIFELGLLLDREAGKGAIARIAEEQGLAAVGDQDDAVVGDLHRALRLVASSQRGAEAHGCPTHEAPA